MLFDQLARPTWRLFVALLLLVACPSLAQVDPFQPTVNSQEVARVNFARERLHSGAIDEAESLLQGVLARLPDYYRAQYNLGLAYLAKDEGALAVVALTKAKDLREQLRIAESTIYNSLGWALHLKGDFASAEAAYLQGVALSGQNSRESNQRLFNNLGALYIRVGRLDDAERVLTRAKDEFGSEYANLNLNIVRSLRASSEYRAAATAPTRPPA